MDQFFKDFAGPFATIVALVVAAGITFYFASRQVQIANQQAAAARQQAETALDQLHYNLFERRYALYRDVQKLLSLLLNESHKETFEAGAVLPGYIAMDEAKFFFSVEICLWLAEVMKDCQSFLAADASGDRTKRSEMSKVLLEHIKELPTKFGEELEFKQLTCRKPYSY